MLLRKLVVALGPVLLCLVTCMLYRWLDGLMAAGGFFLYGIKGVLLGVCLALVLPAAGLTLRTNGLAGWLLAGAGVLALVLLYQYLETIHLLSWPVVKAMLSINGQVVMVEGTVMGYLLVAGLMNRKR